jgi:hypothetical protein
VVTNVVDVGLIDVTGNWVIEFVDDTIEVGDASIVESGVVEKVPPWSETDTCGVAETFEEKVKEFVKIGLVVIMDDVDGKKDENGVSVLAGDREGEMTEVREKSWEADKKDVVDGDREGEESIISKYVGAALGDNELTPLELKEPKELTIVDPERAFVGDLVYNSTLAVMLADRE